MEIYESPGIQELILQHLSASDLLTTSLVSKRWYHKIGKSSAFKSKVIIRVDSTVPTKLRDESVEYLKFSEREYEILKIRDRKLKHESEFIASKAWKRVQLDMLDLDQRQFSHLLEAASMVTRLTISNVQVSLKNTIAIEFPNLEELFITIAASGADVIKPFIARHRKLKKLYLDERKATVLDESYIILMKNPTIKSLHLRCCNVGWMQHPMQFKLSYLSLLTLEPPLEQLDYEYWKNFMRVQGETIEKLTLINWQYSYLIYSTWDLMPNLKKLTLDCGIDICNIPLMFPAYGSDINVIEDLKEISIYGCELIDIPEKFLTTIFKSAPNLCAEHPENLVEPNRTA